MLLPETCRIVLFQRAWKKLVLSILLMIFPHFEEEGLRWKNNLWTNAQFHELVEGGFESCKYWKTAVALSSSFSCQFFSSSCLQCLYSGICSSQKSEADSQAEIALDMFLQQSCLSSSIIWRPTFDLSDWNGCNVLSYHICGFKESLVYRRIKYCRDLLLSILSYVEI